MSVQVNVDDYKQFAASLKGADRKVRSALRKRLVEVAQPLADQVIATAPDQLPAGGGLADLLRTASAGLSLTATRMAINLRSPGHDLAAINRGRLRHPTYGHKPWVTQGVHEKAYDEAFDQHIEDHAEEIGDVLTDIMESL